MRSPSLTSVAFALALVVGGLAACGDESDGDEATTGGGDGLSAEEQAYADAWATSLADDDDGFGASASEAACMGDAIMAELGVERFEEAGLQPEDITAGDDSSPGELLGAGAISEAEANAILDSWEGCVDLPALFAASAVDDFELDDEARACVEEELSDGDLVRQGFIVSFTSDSDEPPAELVSALVSVLDGCTSSSGGEGGGLIVDEIAASIAADGNLTGEQAQCVAQAMVDGIGLDRLLELGGEDMDLDDAPPEVQQEVASAVLEAAGACDVPLSQLGG